jgi:hypothetical protein
MSRPKDDYSEKEAKAHFEAALRGARIGGHKPKDSMTPRRGKGQQKLVQELAPEKLPAWAKRTIQKD